MVLAPAVDRVAAAPVRTGVEAGPPILHVVVGRSRGRDDDRDLVDLHLSATAVTALGAARHSALALVPNGDRGRVAGLVGVGPDEGRVPGGDEGRGGPLVGDGVADQASGAGVDPRGGREVGHDCE